MAIDFEKMESVLIEQNPDEEDEIRNDIEKFKSMSEEEFVTEMYSTNECMEGFIRELWSSDSTNDEILDYALGKCLDLCLEKHPEIDFDFILNASEMDKQKFLVYLRNGEDIEISENYKVLPEGADDDEEYEAWKKAEERLNISVKSLLKLFDNFKDEKISLFTGKEKENWKYERWTYFVIEAVLDHGLLDDNVIDETYRMVVDRWCVWEDGTPWNTSVIEYLKGEGYLDRAKLTY